MPDLEEVKVNEVGMLTEQQIRDKIELLSSTEDGEPLAKAMLELKTALKANPAAANYLLPEEIGKLVEAVRRRTNKQIIADLTPGKKASTAKVTKLSKEEIDSISIDDLL